MIPTLETLYFKGPDKKKMDDPRGFTFQKINKINGLIGWAYIIKIKSYSLADSIWLVPCITAKKILFIGCLFKKSGVFDFLEFQIKFILPI